MEHGVGKREQKRSTGIVVPVQGTLAQRIQVGHQQNANENAHGRERFRIHHNIVPEIDGPGERNTTSKSKMTKSMATI